MSMRKNKSVFESIRVAAGGFLLAVKAEKSIRQIGVTAILLVGLGIWAGTGYFETLMLLFAWIIVITFEIFNTALEKAMDYASGKEYHPLIKKGKDFSGASVFVVSTFALVFSGFVILKNFSQAE